MSNSELLHEYWTDEGSAVVVTAERSLIHQLLTDLNLPEESPVNVSDSKIALALWGEDLSTYRTWRMRFQANSNGAVHGIGNW